MTRRWIDQAKQQNQTINSSAPDGTYAAGVHRVTELIPVLMNDLLQSAPEDQKVRSLHYIFDTYIRLLPWLFGPAAHSCGIEDI